MPATRVRNLNSIIDEMFEVFEHIHTMLQGWRGSYHLTFIDSIIRLRELEDALHKLGYDANFVLAVKREIYRTVFSELSGCG